MKMAQLDRRLHVATSASANCYLTEGGNLKFNDMTNVAMFSSNTLNSTQIRWYNINSFKIFRLTLTGPAAIPAVFGPVWHRIRSETSYCMTLHGTPATWTRS
jgi:hypothetical protein